MNHRGVVFVHFIWDHRKKFGQISKLEESNTREKEKKKWDEEMDNLLRGKRFFCREWAFQACGCSFCKSLYNKSKWFSFIRSHAKMAWFITIKAMMSFYCCILSFFRNSISIKCNKLKLGQSNLISETYNTNQIIVNTRIIKRISNLVKSETEPKKNGLLVTGALGSGKTAFLTELCYPESWW